MFVWFIKFLLSDLTPIPTPVPLPSLSPFPPFPFQNFTCPECPTPYPIPPCPKCPDCICEDPNISCPECPSCPQCPDCICPRYPDCPNLTGIPLVNATLLYPSVVFPGDKTLFYKNNRTSMSYFLHEYMYYKFIDNPIPPTNNYSIPTFLAANTTFIIDHDSFSHLAYYIGFFESGSSFFVFYLTNDSQNIFSEQIYSTDEITIRTESYTQMTLTVYRPIAFYI